MPETIKWILFVYLFLMNLIGFLSMLIDKRRARKNGWRIRERTLFLLAILGGSIGSLSGMYIFRHKTRHWYFVLGMPLILFLQAALTLFFLIRS
ncbi:MAG: DUF1294 domain-containing protein [Lachnospiraceae bacterium]|nr:DUF1294 domain-containing protein [Lachnospiraceae bacterium]